MSQRTADEIIREVCEHLLPQHPVDPFEIDQAIAASQGYKLHPNGFREYPTGPYP